MTETVTIKGLTGDPDAIWGVGKVATLFQVSAAAIYAAVEKGHLKAYRLGPKGQIRIREADLVDWIKPYVPTSGRMPARTTTDDAPQSPLERDALGGPQ